MQVRVCNFRSNEFEQDFMKSVLETGFAVLTHHGIDHEFIKDAQRAWKMFFLSNQENKNSYINVQDGNMGYKGMKQEKAVGAKVADLKEFYHWKPGQKLPTDTWAITQHMFYQLEDVAMKLLTVLDRNYEIPNPGYRDACFQSDNTILRMLYYPALKDVAVEPGAVRAAAHEDINFITLLVAASAPGLEIMDNKGNWHAVPHEENSIAVNIGDMLQLISGTYYKSTTHRVVNPDSSGSDRLSMPLFVHPHGSTLLADNFTAQDFLNQRMNEIYLSKNK